MNFKIHVLPHIQQEKIENWWYHPEMYHKNLYVEDFRKVDFSNYKFCIWYCWKKVLLTNLIPEKKSCKYWLFVFFPRKVKKFIFWVHPPLCLKTKVTYFSRNNINIQIIFIFISVHRTHTSLLYLFYNVKYGKLNSYKKSRNNLKKREIMHLSLSPLDFKFDLLTFERMGLR